MNSSKKNDIIGVIIVIILAIWSLWYAVHTGNRTNIIMTCAACGIILYLLIRDYRYKKKIQEDEEKVKNGGHRVISVSKKKDQHVNIGNIAHTSTKNIDSEEKAGDNK